MRHLNGLSRIVVAAVLLLLATATRAGIVGEEDMVNLTLNDGLSGETVYGVMTDHNGYVWLATSGGVSVYNGKGLSTFNILDEQGQRLTVYDICEVDNCQIWAATEEGLYCLHHGEKTFRRMLPEVEHPTSLMVTGDTLYIGSQQGLQFYAGGKLERRDVGVSRNGLDNVVRQYAKGEDGRIWFLSRHDLNSYDPRTGKVTRHQSSLSDMTLLAEQQEEAEEGSGGNKYQQVKMTDEECADIVRRMRHYLETEQAYVNSDLKRADLARVLHVPVAKLSYVFSMHLNENYYEFVNRYRLERFKQLIAEGAYKRFTLTALSEQCGFRKSSFFSTFRKVEGMTPTEYLKKQNIKIDIS